MSVTHNTQTEIYQMKIAITTQHMENYGAHDWNGKGECPQYWKMKGSGKEFVVPISIDKVLELGRAGIQAIVDNVGERYNIATNYSREYVIGWTLLEDAELTVEEKMCKEMNDDGYGVMLDQQILKRIE